MQFSRQKRAISIDENKGAPCGPLETKRTKKSLATQKEPSGFN
jgi:hypothetical protein|tara:strand:- start:100 stop:228 length:129 start_codon:yes stop_codon:yes gene_type:complete